MKIQTLLHSTLRSIAAVLLGVGTLITAPAADAATFKLVYSGSI